MPALPPNASTRRRSRAAHGATAPLALLAATLLATLAIPSAAEACGRCGGRCGLGGTTAYRPLTGFAGTRYMAAPPYTVPFTTMRPGLFGWRQRTFVPYAARYSPFTAMPVSVAPTYAGYAPAGCCGETLAAYAPTACGCAPTTCDPCGGSAATTFDSTLSSSSFSSSTFETPSSSCPSGLCGAGYAPNEFVPTESVLPSYDALPGETIIDYGYPIADPIADPIEPTQADPESVLDPLNDNPNSRPSYSNDRATEQYNPGPYERPEINRPPRTFDDDVPEGQFGGAGGSDRDRGGSRSRDDRGMGGDRGNGFGVDPLNDPLNEPIDPPQPRTNQPRPSDDFPAPDRRDRSGGSQTDPGFDNFNDFDTEEYNKPVQPKSDRVPNPLDDEFNDGGLDDGAGGAGEPEVRLRPLRAPQAIAAIRYPALDANRFAAAPLDGRPVRRRTVLPVRYRLPRHIARRAEFETPAASAPQLAAN